MDPALTNLLANGLAQGFGLQRRAMFTDLKGRLRETAEQLNQHGNERRSTFNLLGEMMTLLGADADSNDHRSIKEGARKLIEKGANPLTDPDQPLSNHRYSFVLQHLILDVLGELEQKGEGMRNDKGENALHILAGQPREVARDTRSGETLCALWVNQKREDGLTPLQVLWGRDQEECQAYMISLFKQNESNQFNSEAENKRVAHYFESVQAWTLTERMFSMGAEISMEDEGNLPVAEAIKRRMEKGISFDKVPLDYPPGFASNINELLAMAEQKELDRQTPEAGSTRKPGTRL